MDDTNKALYLESVENSAVIYVGAPLDRESMTTGGDIYTLWITVSDGKHSGVPALLKIKITDVNDNPPVFEKNTYSFQVSEVSVIKIFVAVVPVLSGHSKLKMKVVLMAGKQQK